MLRIRDKHKEFFAVLLTIVTYVERTRSLSLLILFSLCRTADIFVGVDVFGRGCFGGGGFNSAAALKKIRSEIVLGLSNVKGTTCKEILFLILYLGTQE